MLPRPPQVRNMLTEYLFKETRPGKLCLRLPIFYADVFDCSESNLIENGTVSWKVDSFGRGAKYCYPVAPTEDEIEQIQNFINDYASYIVLGKTPFLESEFDSELDFCFALDKNFSTVNTRTDIGELEYQAKYQQSHVAREKLIEHLSVLLYNRGLDLAYDKSKAHMVTYIPAEASKTFNLPALLAQGVVKEIRDNDGIPITLLNAVLNMKKNPMKSASVVQKNMQWRAIVEAQAIQLSESVKGKTVYVIDDMFQSGTTLWWYARYLKTCGANRVIGLICVKSGKDTDNTDRGW